VLVIESFLERYSVFNSSILNLIRLRKTVDNNIKYLFIIAVLFFLLLIRNIS